MAAQLMAWFGDYGFPVVPLGGYSSQTLVGRVKADMSASGRQAVLIYAGDFDPTGEDFAERTDCFAKVIRVAVLPERVDEYGLTENPGKESDTRSAGFVARHGRNVQVELEALDPAVMRQLYTDTSASAPTSAAGCGTSTPTTRCWHAKSPSATPCSDFANAWNGREHGIVTTVAHGPGRSAE